MILEKYWKFAKIHTLASRLMTLLMFNRKKSKNYSLTEIFDARKKKLPFKSEPFYFIIHISENGSVQPYWKKLVIFFLNSKYTWLRHWSAQLGWQKEHLYILNALLRSISLFFEFFSKNLRSRIAWRVINSRKLKRWIFIMGSGWSQ